MFTDPLIISITIQTQRRITPVLRQVLSLGNVWMHWLPMLQAMYGLSPTITIRAVPTKLALVLVLKLSLVLVLDLALVLMR